MLKIFFLINIFVSFSFAISQNQLYTYYKNKDYKNLCIMGNYMKNKLKNNDKYLSLIGLSCIKADMINTAVSVSKFMKNSKISRNNASYIANLYLIKKLLMQFVYDKIDLSDLSLPKSNYFLYTIFENISKHNYKEENNKIIVNTKDKTYILKPLISDNSHKICVIIIDKKTNEKSKHFFW